MVMNYKKASAETCRKGQGQEFFITKESLIICITQMKSLGSQKNKSLHKTSLQGTGEWSQSQVALSPSLTIFLPSFPLGESQHSISQMRVITS